MLFNSVEYLFFFPAVVILYFSIPDKWKWVLLLIASYIFYMFWKMEYVVLIMFTTLVDYLLGLKLAQNIPKQRKKLYLLLSIVVNLGMLTGFKYLNFFSESLNGLLGFFNTGVSTPVFNILLPVGISFYIFQSLSYTIDVYRGIAPAEKHLGRFALYVSFFPQLVAGPIERSTSLLPQIVKPSAFNEQRLVSGLKLILWGYFKKLVIADRLSMFVDYVYNNPQQNAGVPIFIATIMFAFQLYCDFSGYTDIARGSARVLGYDLMINFNRPFIAKSLRDFWNRWHISLTTWFRDYLLYSLPYIKNNKIIYPLLQLNLFITFLVMGLWHGASWTFVLFGAFNGIMIILEIRTQNIRNRFYAITGINKIVRLKDILATLSTFSTIIFSLYFFRANSIGDSFLLIRNTFDLSTLNESFFFMMKDNELMFGILMVILLLIAEQMHAKYNLVLTLATKPTVFKWTVYLGFSFFVILFGVLNAQKFIYFQF